MLRPPRSPRHRHSLATSRLLALVPPLRLGRLACSSMALLPVVPSTAWGAPLWVRNRLWKRSIEAPRALPRVAAALVLLQSLHSSLVQALEVEELPWAADTVHVAAVHRLCLSGCSVDLIVANVAERVLLFLLPLD